MKWPYYQKFVNHTNSWNLALPIFEVFVQILWMWVFPSIKLSWNSCSMRDKPGRLNWFWQFLCEMLSSFNSNRFCYSYAWSYSLCEGRTSLCTRLISRKLWILTHVFDWLYFTLSVLLLIPLLITFFVFMHSFWCYFV